MFESGAAEVHVRITAPPIKHPCFYGIDMASKGELAASVMTIEELGAHIGATSLGYLSLEGAVEACGRPMDEFCHACFNGRYPIPIRARCEQARLRRSRRTRARWRVWPRASRA